MLHHYQVECTRLALDPQHSIIENILDWFKIPCQISYSLFTSLTTNPVHPQNISLVRTMSIPELTPLALHVISCSKVPGLVTTPSTWVLEYGMLMPLPYEFELLPQLSSLVLIKYKCICGQ